IPSPGPHVYILLTIPYIHYPLIDIASFQLDIYDQSLHMSSLILVSQGLLLLIVLNALSSCLSYPLPVPLTPQPSNTLLHLIGYPTLRMSVSYSHILSR